LFFSTTEKRNEKAEKGMGDEKMMNGRLIAPA